MWGKCANGTEAVGCGKPETFRNCADIAITSNTGGLPPIFVGSNNPYLLYYKDLRAPSEQNVFPLVVRYDYHLNDDKTTTRNNNLVN